MEKNPDYNQLVRLAQSPAGQQLWKLLQKSDGNSLQKAMSAATTGDYAQAKSILASLLSSQEAEALLHKLEESL